jgi:hypothetical protein
LAKLYEPGDAELFQALGKTIDFYYYKGQLCARTLPTHCNQPGTPAQQVTWIACAQSWQAVRYMTPRDVLAWKRMVEGSALTWTDGMRKSFMIGYNKIKGTPPFVWDVVRGLGPHGFRIGYRAATICQVRLYYDVTRSDLYNKYYHWEYNKPGDPPPNCRKKVEIWESWPRQKTQLYTTPGARAWFTMGMLPVYFHFVYTIHTQKVPMVVPEIHYRTGVYDKNI